LAIACVAPSALAGWLAALIFWSGLPLGAICLVMMMRLMPGAWRTELEGFSEAAMLLMPLAFIAILPVIAALPSVYEWAHQTQHGFRGLYLTPWFFTLRTFAFFVVASILVVLLLLRRHLSATVSAAGLIVFVLFDTTIAVDWVMSLDPSFHSSGFGLYALSIQATITLAVLILLRLVLRPSSHDTGILGGLLLTALLLWAYLAFMQYFISWSDDLPDSVLWYQRRAEGFWSPIEYAIGALGLLPAFLLLFDPIRSGRAWLLGLCVAILIGKALECAWLVLPDTDASGLTFIVASIAFVSIGTLTVAGLIAALRSPLGAGFSGGRVAQ
jgi:hypothetical protein